MGKAAKEHRRKIQARNNKIKQDKDRAQKFQREFIMNLIKQEQEKGLFENNQDVNKIVSPIDAIQTDSTQIEGPSI
jgi:hypothetical protein